MDLREIEDKIYLNSLKITAYENILKRAESVDYQYEQNEKALMRVWAEQRELCRKRMELK